MLAHIISGYKNMLEIFLTILIVAISLYGYVMYGLETKRKVLRPRAATWLIWAILGTCVSYLQLKHGAGLGAIVTVVTASANYVLAGMAWRYGNKNIHPVDILSSLAAVGVLILWATVADERDDRVCSSGVSCWVYPDFRARVS